MMWLCGTCPDGLAFTSIQALSDHLSTHHHKAPVFTCIQDNCNNQFLNKSSLLRHLHTFHSTSDASSSHFGGPSSSRTELEKRAFHQWSGQSSSEVPHSEDLDNESNEGLLNLSSVTSEDETVPPVNLKKVAAEVVMELRSKASLTGKAVERFQDGCTKLLENYKMGIIEKVQSSLKSLGISDQDSVAVIEGIPDATNIFSDLRTIQDQLNVFAEEFGLVKPVEKFLRTRIDQRLDPLTNSYVQTQVNVSFQYVSIIETLKTILSSPKNRSSIFKDFSSEDGILRSYMDGDHFKNHPLVAKYGTDVIHILLFFDEVEVTNSLGSKTIIHKLGAFFFQILNSAASTSSKLSSIHLLILAYADELKVPGAFEKVLAPYVLEMKKLSSEEGVRMTVDRQVFVIRAVLTGVSADSLAAHDLLGFLSPSANYFCRLCLIHRADFRQDGNLMATARRKETHDVHVQEVTADPSKSSSCGVKRGCALNELPYFHSSESSVLDAFHDLLEGIVPLVLKLVLREFIVIRNVMTLKEFNISVASFPYGLPDARNKPTPNFTREMLISRKNLKQTGSQMWCLLRAFPFLIVDKQNKIQPGDKHLEIVFLLQDMTKTIFSFEVSPADIERLDALIYQHNDLFKSLFIDTPVELEVIAQLQPAPGVPGGEQLVDPEEGDEGIDDPDDPEVMMQEEVEAQAPEEEVNEEGRRRRLRKLIIRMINKLHHLKHYPEQMRKCGPLIRMWCAKFEGRLKIFRQHSAACCNFRNIPKTMAEMFQLSNVLHQDEEVSVEFQQGTECSVGDLGILQPLFHSLGLFNDERLCITNSATFCGEEYRPSLFVRICSLIRHSPKFAIINNVYVHDKNVYLLVKPWKVVCLSARYNCYRVLPDDTSLLSLVNVKNLANFRAMSPWSPSCESDCIYLSLRTDSI